MKKQTAGCSGSVWYGGRIKNTAVNSKKESKKVITEVMEHPGDSAVY